MPHPTLITRRLVQAAPLVCAGVLALTAGPALASGGAASGGAAKPTAPVAAPASGGGTTAPGGGGASGTGGSGGGASGGGHNATEPTQPTAPAPAPVPTSPPVTTPCATIPVATSPTGYVNGGTAIWHDIAVASCDSLPENLNIEAIDKDPETGQVEYEQYVYWPVSGYGNTGAQLDNDLVPYGTTYTITYNVYDADTGKLLASSSGSATTPAAQ